MWLAPPRWKAWYSLPPRRSLIDLTLPDMKPATPTFIFWTSKLPPLGQNGQTLLFLNEPVTDHAEGETPRHG